MKHAVAILLVLMLQVNCVAACLIDCREMMVPAASTTPHCHEQSSNDDSNSSKPHETAGCADARQVAFENDKGPSIGLQQVAALDPEVETPRIVAAQSLRTLSVSDIAAPRVSSNLILRI